MKYILILLFGCSYFYGFCQTSPKDTLLAKKLITEALKEQQGGAFASSTQKLEQVLQIYAHHERWDDFLINKTQIIRNYWRGGLPDTALVLCQEILNSKHFEPNSLIAAELYSNLGVIHDKKGLYPEALEYYKKGLAIRKEKLGNDHIETGKIYFNIGACYTSKQEYSKGIEYFEYTLQNFQKSLPENHPYFISIYRNLSVSYQHLSNSKKALENIGFGLAIAKKIYPPDHFQILQLKNDKIVIYAALPGLKQKAIDLYLEILPPLTKIYGETHYQIVTDYLNLHFLYSNIGSPPEEAYYLEKAAKILLANYSSKDPLVTTLYNYTSNSYAIQRNDSLDLAYRHKSIISLLPEIADNLPLDQVVDYENVVVSDIKRLSQMLGAKTKLLFRLKNKQTKKDYTALYQQSLIDGAIVINRIKKEISKLDDQIEVLTKSRVYLNYKIADYLNLPTPQLLESIVLEADQSKSILLQAALSSNNALKFGNIPDSLKSKEANLKKSIAQLQQKINAASIAKDKTTLETSKKELFQLNEKFNNLSALLEKNYPNYFQLKYSQEYPSIQDIQTQLLDEKTILFNYLLEKENIVIIRISSSEVFVNKVAIDSSFGAKLAELTKALKNIKYIHNNPKKAYASFTQNSYFLYEKLLGNLIPNGIENLIIIPDYELGRLPFEILLTEKQSSQNQDYKNLPYLLKKYNIRYAYSASLLLDNKSKTNKSNKMVAFSATYNPSLSTDKVRQKLIDLPGAQTEVEKLKENFDGDFFIANQANEYNFNQLDFSKYSVLHLAMHGIMNKENPMSSSLAFTADTSSTEDDFVHAFELTNMSIPSNLVVLSACETGDGKIEKVEGIMSLGRSFMYAGTPSIVMSLWQVNDISTSRIMELFYSYLAQGLRKDEALRKAKLDYLELAEGLALHPNFWAPFIQLGDASPIQLKKKSNFFSSWGLWVFGVLIVLILSIIVYRKKEL